MVLSERSLFLQVMFEMPVKVEDRHELQSKLETLESIGCSKDQIQESPEILLLTEREILRRVERLRHCGIRQINVMTLKLGHIRSKAVLLERASALQAATAGKDTLAASMADKLQYNEMEWYMARKKFVYLRHVRDMPYFNTKVDYLFNLGFSIDDIKQNIMVLNKSLGCMKTRVKAAASANVLPALTLQVINMTDKMFNKWLQSARMEKQALGEFSDRFEVFADLLGVSPMDIKQNPVFRRYSLHRMKSLIELLLENGLKKDDILCHAHILIRGSKCILQSLDRLKELGLSQPSVVQIVNIINGRQVSKRQSKKSELVTVAELLETNLSQIEQHRALLRSTLLKGKFAIRKSVHYLQSQGFSSGDILCCPLLLGHDLPVLKSYVQSYRDHEDFEKLEAGFANDKGKILNWIQYLIEKDINFSSQEAIAEEDDVD